jgi:hypothetical protein
MENNLYCTDYDSMGNHGRFPMVKRVKKTNMSRFIQKIILFWGYIKPKKGRKSIWKL